MPDLFGHEMAHGPKIETTEIVAPAYWATAFIYGDMTGMDGAEEVAFEKFCKGLDGWEIVDVKRDLDGDAEDPWFTWDYRLHGGTANGGEVVTYVAIKHGGEIK